MKLDPRMQELLALWELRFPDKTEAELMLMLLSVMEDQKESKFEHYYHKIFDMYFTNKMSPTFSSLTVKTLPQSAN